MWFRRRPRVCPLQFEGAAVRTALPLKPGGQLSPHHRPVVRQLLEPGFAYRVLSTPFEFNVAPPCLTLELTESSLLDLRPHDFVHEALRQSGVPLATEPSRHRTAS